MRGAEYMYRLTRSLRIGGYLQQVRALEGRGPLARVPEASVLPFECRRSSLGINGTGDLRQSRSLQR